MADDNDIASDLEILFTQAAIEANRTTANRLSPNGYCYNCEVAVREGALFCHVECEQDYTYYTKRKEGFEKYSGAV